MLNTKLCLVLTKVSIVFFLNVITVIAFGGPHDIELKTAIGTEFLVVPPKPSREEAIEKLKSIVMERLPQLSNWPEDYSKLNENRAVAISYRSPSPSPFVPYWHKLDHIEPHISWWGGAWNQESMEDARQKAINGCKGDCILFMENDNVVLPNSVINEFIDARAKFTKIELDRLVRAERVNLLAEANIKATSSSDADPGLTAIQIPIPHKLNIGNPDRQQDYSDICQDRVFYPLIPVTNENQDTALKHLDKLEKKGVFGKYQRTLNTVKNHRNPTRQQLSRRMGRFVRGIEINSDQNIGSRLIFPQYLRDSLMNRRIMKIWLEGAVRLTKDGLPLVVDDYFAPIAIQLEGRLYVGIEVRLPDEGDGCYVSKPFSGKVMDLSVCADDIGCAQNATKILLDNLRATFTSRPISSEIISNEEFAPGEFALKRVRKKSEIIGGPTYEISTYTVETWVADKENPWSSLYHRERYRGVDIERVNGAKSILLFLKISHMYTTSTHKNGKYSEPSSNEVARFEQVISNATKDALSKTCLDLKGDFDSNLCTLN